MPRYYLLMSRLDDRKQFAEGCGWPARSPCSMKPIRPGSSVSTRRLLSYGKPLFACPRPSSPKSCKSDLADPGDLRVIHESHTPAQAGLLDHLTGIPFHSIKSM